MLRARSKSFQYKKAMALQEKGAHTWRVVTDLVKHRNGLVTYSVYELQIPSKHRAVSLARVLNQASL